MSPAGYDFCGTEFCLPGTDVEGTALLIRRRLCGMRVGGSDADKSRQEDP
jgi:hypothetical protein